MERIDLTPEQSAKLMNAPRPVAIHDSQGNLIAVVRPTFTDADVAEAERALASDQPRYTFQQVMEHLRSIGPA
jgi:hypothetical protein